MCKSLDDLMPRGLAIATSEHLLLPRQRQSGVREGRTDPTEKRQRCTHSDTSGQVDRQNQPTSDRLTVV